MLFIASCQCLAQGSCPSNDTNANALQTCLNDSTMSTCTAYNGTIWVGTDNDGLKIPSSRTTSVTIQGGGSSSILTRCPDTAITNILYVQSGFSYDVTLEDLIVDGNRANLSDNCSRPMESELAWYIDVDFSNIGSGWALVNGVTFQNSPNVSLLLGGTGSSAVEYSNFGYNPNTSVYGSGRTSIYLLGNSRAYDSTVHYAGTAAVNAGVDSYSNTIWVWLF